MTIDRRLTNLIGTLVVVVSILSIIHHFTIGPGTTDYNAVANRDIARTKAIKDAKAAAHAKRMNGEYPGSAVKCLMQANNNQLCTDLSRREKVGNDGFVAPIYDVAPNGTVLDRKYSMQVKCGDSGAYVMTLLDRNGTAFASSMHELKTPAATVAVSSAICGF